MKRLSFFLLLLAFSCKETEVAPDTFLSFLADGEPAVINHEDQSITLTLGEDALWKSVKIDFTTSKNALVEIDGKPVLSGAVVNLSEVSLLTLRSSDGSEHRFTLKKSSVFEEFGMGRIQERYESLNRSYSFYLDQYGTGMHQYINCGPTVVTMALRWSDPAFHRSAADARNALRPEGGWWYTTDIHNYLRQFGVTPGYYLLPVTLSVEEYETKIAEVIDSGHMAILCLDMYYVRENKVPAHRTNRFYAADTQGWGHFVLAKGYRIIDGKMWLEIHDPYSIDQKYANGQLKGDRRYYDPAEIKKATDIWWPFTMIVPRKDASVSARFKTDPGLVPAQKGRGAFR